MHLSTWINTYQGYVLAIWIPKIPLTTKLGALYNFNLQPFYSANNFPNCTVHSPEPTKVVKTG